MIYLRLFYEFFKAGLFAVGGGLATLPFLYDISDTTGWFTHADLADMVAVSESTPGPIGVNMATFVGYRTAGVPGALTATFGLVLPSVIVIILIAGFLKRFRDNFYVNSAFYGLRPASTGLIAAAGVSVAMIAFINADEAVGSPLGSALNYKALALAAAIVLLSDVIKPTKKLHPAVFLAISAAAGIIFKF